MSPASRSPRARAHDDGLDAIVRPDLRFHYTNEVGASAWLRLCLDPAFGHAAKIAAASRILPELITTAVGSGSTIGICSLGPGDGRMDHALLDRLYQTLRLRSFIGVDSSPLLLAVARQTLEPLVHAHPETEFRTLLADFVSLQRANLPGTMDGVPTVFLLLGLTLGNYAELTVLRAIRAMMTPGDWLAIDARLHAFGPNVTAEALPAHERAPLLAAYDQPECRRLAFAPVEAATLARADDHLVRFEVSSAYTDVPGAVCVTSFTRDLHTTMRDTGLPVHRDRLDLGVTTSYDRRSLERWLGTNGWAVRGGDVTDSILRLILAPAARG